MPLRFIAHLLIFIILIYFGGFFSKYFIYGLQKATLFQIFFVTLRAKFKPQFIIKNMKKSALQQARATYQPKL
ncbi:MAG: hypothetical protein K2G94_07660, partial [Muribaculaceae bacterium]|nr:hypothetical protein [Muribaculaceae bacterium]